MKYGTFQKRFLAALLICIQFLVLFSACGLSGSNTYVVIEEHEEQVSAYVQDDTVTTNSYLSLKNAILGFITNGIEEGNVRVEAYTADLPEDISQIVYEVSRQNPAGAYMVDYMTYDYSKIVNYYDISLHITYKHDSADLESLVYLSDSEQVREQLKIALQTYQNVLLLDISSYTELEIRDMVTDLLEDNPEISLCIPEVTVNVYPDTGSQRILEIRMNYPAAAEDMVQAEDTLIKRLDEYISLYQDIEDKESVVRRVFYRLCRNASVVTAGNAQSPFYDSMYGAVISKEGTEKSYAVAYRQILLRLGIFCSLVNGSYHHSSKTFCRVEINGNIFYVDPAGAIKSDDMTDFEMDTTELIERGYTIIS